MAKGKSVLSTAEVAEICCVAPRTVQKWIDTGFLKGYIVPGTNHRRVTPDELRKFLKKNKMPFEKEFDEWMKKT